MIIKKTIKIKESPSYGDHHITKDNPLQKEMTIYFLFIPVYREIIERDLSNS